VQDEIQLVEDRLLLTLGTKLEHNDYSGFEVQPSVRLAWRPATNQTIWAAVSRAVRSPSRIDAEFFFPGGDPPYATAGAGDRFTSEKLIAYELGYRVELTRNLNLSLSTFYNDYDDIRSVEPVREEIAQTLILNGLKAETYGVELAATWRAADWWRLRGGYTAFKKTITVLEADVNEGRGEGNDPHHQFLLQSMMDLPAHFEFDSVLRWVDNLNQLGPSVPSYLALDLRLAWHPRPNIELAVVGQNLLDNQHPEFGTAPSRQEIPRSVYGKVSWKF
jgi:iron complex outermembrane receptor protein